ncbi:MAG TPA: hypothetical protein VLW55_00505 [Burkholderiaceae bacterium]|nr:hypothetical protein [Burkholderiaceae bacterium]
MDRIAPRLSAAILAATATLAVLSGIASLAGLESSHDLPVAVMPAIVVTATRSEVLADACSDASERQAEPQDCMARKR